MYSVRILMIILTLASWKLFCASSTDDNADLLIVKAADDIMNAMIEESEILVRNALADIPNGIAYDEHRENLKKFIQATEDYKSKTGDCQAKRLKYNQTTSSIMRSYLEATADASTEHKVMARLLNKHGMRELRAKFKKLLEEVYSGKYGSPTKNIENVYAEYTANNCYTEQKTEL
ncbi:uncharacterized protein LOC142227453 [Haematobia irritans]|uniref:uncharacterized protein LOC142227453 n=1 Tax=Haematobia irritans TaxID=7368 RepID=UPI003F50BC69